MPLFLRKTRQTRPSRFTIPPEAAKIAAYWQDSLLEGDRADISDKEFLAAGLEVPLADARTGHCSKHCVRALREKQLQKERHLKRHAGRNAAEQIPVLIAPLRFARTTEGRGPRFLEPMWVPARMLPSGELRPPSSGGPWIPRNLLDPPVSSDTLVLGTVESLARFAAKNPPLQWQDWKEYWSYAEKLSRAVLRSDLRAVSVDGYAREPNPYIGLDPSGAGAAGSLVKVLEEVKTGVRHPGLFLHFAAMREPARRDYTRSLRTLTASARRHCGQFGSKFPLAPSQRDAVHRFMETPQGDYLCVTGPPGTGKTTLLQSLIASLYVQAVGSKNARPPVVVACGATNQSVMNIIDSLEKTTADDSLFAERWIPSLHSFGTFCCSNRKAKEIEGYQLELRDGSGLSASLEQPEFIKEASKHFLAKYTDWSGKKSSLRAAAARLRSLVIAERGALYRDIIRAKDGTFSEWVTSLFGLLSTPSSEELMRALEALDMSRRYRAFLLAVHYWEARWLLESSGRKSQSLFSGSRRKDSAGRPSFHGDPVDWQRRAMLTPAFVSTLAMVPRFFASHSNRGAPPIDLLIFDEAGQIPVEAGASCACLAKRAVIVGDCEQLEPVWNVSPHIDAANALKHRLLGKHEQENWAALARRGICSSSGSFMYLALRSTKWTNGSTYGVFLAEHRRCVPPLVKFANTLSYSGRLQPHRSELAERILPAFGYVHVAGASRKVGESRSNKDEVEQISAWLSLNERRLLDFYRSSSLSEVLAVVTPFAAQSSLIQARLRSRYADMTIGTVTSLQGAERNVVLFSSVYDAGHKRLYFFDLSSNMLNVAVSRAKDSFIVFGDMSIFDPERGRPSSVLARFLFESPDNQLLDIPPPMREEVPAEETTRIATLDEHQEVLFDALEQAKERVTIVSPTISSAAILHDRIPGLIAAARKRGVKVEVFTDSYLDYSEGALKPNAAQGRELLRAAGALVHTVKGIHNKAVAVDNHTVVEGSFNWLSAVRAPGSLHQKHEVSWCYRGPKAAEIILRLHDELRHRKRLLDVEE